MEDFNDKNPTQEAISYLQDSGVVKEINKALLLLLEKRPSNVNEFFANYFTKKCTPGDAPFASWMLSASILSDALSEETISKVRSELFQKAVSSPPPKTLFERLGGAAAVDSAVDKFYEKVVRDDRVSTFFNNTDMAKQRQIQKSFLAFAFGGPKKYSGVGMKKAHQKLVNDDGLNDTHFDAIVELLGATLMELNIPSSDINNVISIVESMRNDVLCKQPDKDKSLYDRLGGKSVITSAVDSFYNKIIDSSKVNHFFKNINIKRQKQMQESFLTFAFGGTNNYSGVELKKAHQSLVTKDGLNKDHYDEFIKLLGETLTELQISDTDIIEVIKVANSFREEILTQDVEVVPNTPLFERLGGDTAIDTAVDNLYDHILDDDRVNHFFKGVNMIKQRAIQKSFLKFAFGGPNDYSGLGMRKAHQKLIDEKGLDDTHLDIVIELWNRTLKEMNVSLTDIKEAEAAVNSFRDDILCRDPPAISLYAKLGGEEAVDAAVDQFYEKVLADERVNYFFAKTDMKKQRRIQKSFLTFAFGGPKTYSGVGMRKAHQKLVDEQGLNDTHMDVIVELLGKTLKELGVGDADITEAAAVANSVRDEVLCRPEVPLYERIGGDSMVEEAVEKFYIKVLADDRLKHFFTNLNMSKQRAVQKEFLTYLFGGPNEYDGDGMKKAHAKLVDEKGLNNSHFDAVLELLGKTLSELGVGEAEISEAASRANSVRKDVLCGTESLFVRIGGSTAVDAAVEKLYDKVLADDRVKSFFDNIDMKKQRRIQKSFLTFAFGGPKTYSGVGMRKAHQKLVDEQGLNDTHMDVIVELLGKTLQELGVSDADITETTESVNTLRGEVLFVEAQKTLFDRIGGEEAIAKVVDCLYDKVLNDDRVNDFLKDTNMIRQKRVQKEFLTHLFGGSKEYSGREMRRAHRSVVDDGLNDSHFDIMMQLLEDSLKESKVPEAEIAEATVIVNEQRDDVLCKEQKSLYERIGGEAAVELAVDKFYDRILDDDSVNYFFKDTNMASQRKMQKQFLTLAFGGPHLFTGNIRTGHQRIVDKMGLTDVHFDKVLQHLRMTLKSLGVGASEIKEVGEIAESVRADVLSR